MKKLVLMSAVMLLFCLSACTAPTQRVAKQSLSLGVNHAHTVFYDMSRVARQSVLNESAASVTDAAENQDAEAARMVVKDLFDDMNKIDYLHVQWERARALIREGQQYIDEQEGIIDIMADEISQAQDAVENEASEDSK